MRLKFWDIFILGLQSLWECSTVLRERRSLAIVNSGQLLLKLFVNHMREQIEEISFPDPLETPESSELLCRKASRNLRILSAAALKWPDLFFIAAMTCCCFLISDSTVIQF